jgi:hypothetical protein
VTLFTQQYSNRGNRIFASAAGWCKTGRERCGTRYLKMPRGILERRSSGLSGSCYREASATKTKRIKVKSCLVLKQTAKKPGKRLIQE